MVKVEKKTARKSKASGSQDIIKNMDIHSLEKRVKGISGIDLHIKTTKNNTIALVTDLQGNALFRASGGTMTTEGGKKLLKNSQKGTPHTASEVIATISKILKELNLKEIDSIKIKGTGHAKDTTALMVLVSNGINFQQILFTQRKAHGGCRLKKRRKM